jgi:hypothetical protein
VAFDSDHGKAPFNYALGKNHDGWRIFLPFFIDMATSNTTTFDLENVIASPCVWYPSVDSIFTNLRVLFYQSILTSNYLREPEVNLHLVNAILNTRTQLAYAEKYTSGGTGLVNKWDEYIAALMLAVQDLAKIFATTTCTLATDIHQGNLPDGAKLAQTTQLIIALTDKVGTIGAPVKIKS